MFTSRKIGLIRHFEVVRGMPTRGLMTAADVHTWMREYDLADVIARSVDLGDVDWVRCYASTSARALKTANTIFNGPIVAKDQLLEPGIQQFDTGRLKLPYTGWRWLLRLAWMTGHSSQRPAKAQFLANIDSVLDMLRRDDHAPTLIVSHAGVMMFLRKALLRQGFEGPKFAVPEPGRLYVFEGRWNESPG
jgi:broad specificity phosphatase PhoE